MALPKLTDSDAEVANNNATVKTKKPLLRKKSTIVKYKSVGFTGVPETKNSKKPFKEWEWTPVIQLRLNGRMLTALVDSGASNSLIVRQDQPAGDRKPVRAKKIKKYGKLVVIPVI